MALDKLRIELQNCYGIKSLDQHFDFSAPNGTVYAIYAPNGVLKTSLAQTFADHANRVPSEDRIFPSRVSKRVIVDQAGTEIPPEAVLVIPPYDATLSVTERTSTLLVDASLKQEYETLQADVDRSKESFVEALRQQSGSKKDIEREIASAFTRRDDQFYTALMRVEHEVDSQEHAPFANIAYDSIFNDKVADFLKREDLQLAIGDYVNRYNKLLDDSVYFSRQTFNYYNAGQVAKTLKTHGFFDAQHSVKFNPSSAGESVEITSLDQLTAIVAQEKDRITSDSALKGTFAAIEKQLDKNVDMREFRNFLSENQILLPRLDNVHSLKEDVWKSYCRTHRELYKDLITKYRETIQRKCEIEAKAKEQRTEWERVIDIFNERFFVPFRLELENREAVIVGHDPMPRLGFIFREEIEGGEEVRVGRETLMRTLSQGERKALYILNIIFEVEARQRSEQETLLVVDDIADSFDYRNKYAIIQYLIDISEKPYFKQILLTHNFDFFRTVESRFVGYSQCLVATRTGAGLSIDQARGIKNPFVKDWRDGFFGDARKRVASIPFLRNMIEYTRGDEGEDFATLTSLLHWKEGSRNVRQWELDKIFRSMFAKEGRYGESEGRVVDMIEEAGNACLEEDDGGNGVRIEKKIVLAIATRLVADRFMLRMIDDGAFAQSVRANQTWKLLSRFEHDFGSEEEFSEAVGVLRRVVLMTPENIHLNAFMYEPIVDMSGEHLKKLYGEVKALEGAE